MSEAADGQSTAARGTLGTVRNAVLLLDLLSDGPAYQQLTDLAERSGLAVPTAHRLLRSLVQAQIVHQDSRTSRYSLGPEVVRLSQRYLGRLPVLSALAPYLIDLRDALDATVTVALVVRESVVYVDRVDGRDGGPYRESHRLANALDTAAGRLLIARSDDASWQRCLDTHAGPVPESPDRLRAQWRGTDSLITDDGPAPVIEAAVAVIDSHGEARAALAASFPAHQPERAEQALNQLKRTATAVGRTLGNA
ncbi:IclR family transcriptional regulator [Nocardioides limicola]|uniref:IclR family transcriptional regulator n=1 Tax=Nocardioides limicola TaxID=2803368 RepID=UPI00193C48CF|nr:helix-turn-helix domain-containing protein [Nocardioides sp. DJM-14]